MIATTPKNIPEPEMSQKADAISVEALQDLVNRYPDVVKSGLEDLDAFRFEHLPRDLKVKSESKESRTKGIEKRDLQQLVDWKLKHGTFRPSLAKLAASNDEEEVTRASVAALEKLCEREDDYAHVKEALKEIGGLRGVGPATASLILSCFAPDSIPFFSDELYRWMVWDDDVKGDGGWERKIKYTQKEYIELLERAQSTLSRLREQDESLTMFDLEKAAYVLGKTYADLDRQADDGDESNENRPAKRKRHGQDADDVEDLSRSGVRRHDFDTGRPKRSKSSTQSSKV